MNRIYGHPTERVQPEPGPRTAPRASGREEDAHIGRGAGPSLPEASTGITLDELGLVLADGERRRGTA